MKALSVSLALAIGILILSNCSSKQTLRNDGNKVTAKGVIEVSASSIKERKKKVDLQMRFTNLSNDFLVIPFSDLECRKGKVKGKASAASGMVVAPFYFKAPNQDTMHSMSHNEINVNPEEDKELIISCGFPEKASGQFSLRIKNVYRRPDVTKGGPLQNVAKNLVWYPND